MAEDVPSRLRQRERATLPPKELRVQCPFERLKLLAHRGLRDAETFGRAGDAPFAGDEPKVAEMMEIEPVGADGPHSSIIGLSDTCIRNYRLAHFTRDTHRVLDVLRRLLV